MKCDVGLRVRGLGGEQFRRLVHQLFGDAPEGKPARPLAVAALPPNITAAGEAAAPTHQDSSPVVVWARISE